MQITLFIVGAIVLIFLVLIFYARQKLRNTPLAETHESILELTTSNFNHQLKGKLMLVDFWAEWCAPCKIMIPILNDLAKTNTGNYQIAKVDIDKNQALAKRFNVRSIPTTIVFKDGEEVARYVGVKNKSFLKSQLDKLESKQ